LAAQARPFGQVPVNQYLDDDESSGSVKKLLTTLRLLLAAACLIHASACAHVQLGTLWAMKDVDLLLVNPGVMRIALALPNGASFKKMSINMKFTREGTVLIDDHFDLDIVTTGPEFDKPGLPQEIDNLLLLKIPDSRVADLVHFQNLYASEQSNPRGAQATFGIDGKLDPKWVEENCAAGMKNLNISAWILVDNDQGYLPLLKSSNLGQLLDAKSTGICPKPAISLNSLLSASRIHFCPATYTQVCSSARAPHDYRNLGGFRCSCPAAGRLPATKPGSATIRIDCLSKPVIRNLAATTVARRRSC
jgi:hypothetical protein